jgi:hypothetical protein
MNKILRPFILISLLFSAFLGTAHAQAGDPWIFSPPPGATRTEKGQGLVTYVAGEDQYLLFPAFAVGDGEVEKLAEEFVKVSFPDGNAEIVARKSAGDGITTLIAATYNSKGFFFIAKKQGSQMAVIAYVTTPTSMNNANMERILKAQPRAFGEGTAVTMAGSNSIPAAQNANWPKGGLVPSTTAEINWQQARAMGLNPEDDLLPVTFDCYATKYSRSTSPNPDGILKVQLGGTYSYRSDQVAGGGVYSRESKENNAGYELSGVLLHGSRYSALHPDNDDYGQVIEIREPSKDENKYDRELTCYQQGPTAEAARIMMSRGVISDETMQCQLPSGGVAAIRFGNGTYSSAQGGGNYEDYLISKYNNDWKGGFSFKSGPFKDAIGYLTEDEAGNRSMDVAIYTTTSTMLTSVTDKENLAACYSKSVAKPMPIYGNIPVPATGITAGLSGVYTKLDYYMAGANNMIQIQTLAVVTFKPNGWYYEGIPNNPGIDCTKTKPSGKPICSRYEVKGGMYRVQNDGENWREEDWETLTRAGSKITIGSTKYDAIVPLTGRKLLGKYTMTRGSSSGSVTGVLATSISEGEMVFTADGRLTASRSDWNRIGIGVGTDWAPSAITGARSQVDGNNIEGRYRIEGNWLILTQDNGEELRKYIYADASNSAAGQSPGLIYVDGDDYFKE